MPTPIKSLIISDKSWFVCNGKYTTKDIPTDSIMHKTGMMMESNGLKLILYLRIM